MTDSGGSCCSPSLGDVAPRTASASSARPTAAVPASRTSRHGIEQVAVPAGTFAMGDHHGDGHPDDGETPIHTVTLSAFDIDATSVTNADFATFVDATGYLSESERQGFSAVFHLAFAGADDDVLGTAGGAPWWYGVRGADWRHPDGPGSTIDGRDEHPVVQVSWDDAQAYCAWAGRSLPTEAQWERAARGGVEGQRYPWGDDIPARATGTHWPCNIFQGSFPGENTTEDGFLTTAPVRSYATNALGLWQMVGNVWEWCADWFDPHWYAASPRENPQGPAAGSGRVMRGGSYLCHDSYCNRYRNAARTSNTPDSASGNVGFRTVSR
ncbi:formylglycine-generating enzyme family protein [Tessaracoccus antarcticus]|uniref:Formylglycine-generating enzyme family protein n=1 Tax=Tessaracoccus antarcticus TaxID=2479848 RepID=A0A3M0GAK1_9ACTN|nr:formylglycine-generating enzyme family protein [Tessaracoccus antarcticus]RMB61934.1 formylglycine-generating enzyme family protein [Tessaracoccus antarcticus]